MNAAGPLVTKKTLTQWYFKITEYADRLLDDMRELEGSWPDRVLTMQRNWIGRSVGAHVDFAIEGRDEPVTVFTTRPDTLYGATFFVVAADSALAAELCAPDQRAAFDAYVEQVRRLSDIDRMSTERVKTGVFLGRYAINPVNDERIPVWAADYVLADYGTGAIMAVPAHDQRDLDFARTFGLPVRIVVATDEPDPAETGVATAGDGVHVNSGSLDGLDKVAGIDRIVGELEAKNAGKGAINYRLRDWLLSRQRFWGAPIPIVHCDVDGEVPVPDVELPVRLPDLRGADLQPKGVSPLAAATDWVNTTCPKCGGPAKRDTDTMDTFVDSSWYFLRYCSPHRDDVVFDPADVKMWMPVDQYVGGVEHAILHLLYSRFFVKVLHDMGLVEFDEPFKAMLNQGQVINQGKAMSKSLGNGVDLGEQLAAFGVDAVRMTMLFAGPPEEDIDWADMNVPALGKFLARAWRLAGEVTSEVGVDATDRRPRAAPRDASHRARRHALPRRLPIQRRDRAHHGTGQCDPQDGRCRPRGGRPGCARGGRGGRGDAVAVRALHRRRCVGPPRSSTHGVPRRVAGGRFGLAGRRVRGVRRADQRQGSRRLEVAPDIDEAALRELALAAPAVVKAVDGREIRTVVVRAPKLVNVVV